MHISNGHAPCLNLILNRCGGPRQFRPQLVLQHMNAKYQRPTKRVRITNFTKSKRTCAQCSRGLVLEPKNETQLYTSAPPCVLQNSEGSLRNSYTDGRESYAVGLPPMKRYRSSTPELVLLRLTLVVYPTFIMHVLSRVTRTPVVTVVKRTNLPPELSTSLSDPTRVRGVSAFCICLCFNRPM